jgi:hypothetical protein
VRATYTAKACLARWEVNFKFRVSLTKDRDRAAPIKALKPRDRQINPGILGHGNPG